MGYQIRFINSIKSGAIASMKKHGVLASITIAQAILESSWGRSGLSTKAKNLFGIKAFSSKIYVIMPTTEWSRGKKIRINAKFRKYNSYAESIEDHALFLVKNRRYKRHGFFNTQNYRGQAEALQRAGYATDPNYSKQIIAIVKRYKLYKYDVIEEKGYQKLWTKAFQKFFNKISQSRDVLLINGVYGVKAKQKYLLLGKLLEGKYHGITKEKQKYWNTNFQKWFNIISNTRKPLKVDGIYGRKTKEKYELLEKLMKGEY
ncbi:glycoside hydrolase family 73 protein [Clostridium aestuarii]|uniref:Glycoside hydrolase family 73 protein n=1 Tax=Clostridium aestuarii TaxID=338193 RepID=A0ABT4CY90_9CLOT|nr:glycoside hydrolase family 73 protein [Clostridium aestuarii]MCY6483962.1 glycoside hydrolase family 73 protein [Clostridium aestuarii]